MFEARVYVIAVRGEPPPAWRDCLGGLACAVHPTPAGPVTVLVGTLIDQAAVHGVLQTLHMLGLPLVAVASA